MTKVPARPLPVAPASSAPAGPVVSELPPVSLLREVPRGDGPAARLGRPDPVERLRAAYPAELADVTLRPGHGAGFGRARGKEVRIDPAAEEEGPIAAHELIHVVQQARGHPGRIAASVLEDQAVGGAAALLEGGPAPWIPVRGPAAAVTQHLLDPAQQSTLRRLRRAAERAILEPSEATPAELARIAAALRQLPQDEAVVRDVVQLVADAIAPARDKPNPAKKQRVAADASLPAAAAPKGPIERHDDRQGEPLPHKEPKRKPPSEEEELDDEGGEEKALPVAAAKASSGQHWMWFVLAGNLTGDIWHVAAAAKAIERFGPANYRVGVAFGVKRASGRDSTSQMRTEPMLAYLQSIGIPVQYISFAPNRVGSNVTGAAARVLEGRIKKGAAPGAGSYEILDQKVSTTVLMEMMREGGVDATRAHLQDTLTQGLSYDDAARADELVAQVAAAAAAAHKKGRRLLLVNRRTGDVNTQHNTSDGQFQQVVGLARAANMEVLGVAAPVGGKQDVDLYDVARNKGGQQVFVARQRIAYFWSRVSRIPNVFGLAGGRSGGMDIAAFMGNRAYSWDDLGQASVIDKKQHQRLLATQPIMSVGLFDQAKKGEVDPARFASWLAGDALPYQVTKGAEAVGKPISNLETERWRMSALREGSKAFAARPSSSADPKKDLEILRQKFLELLKKYQAMQPMAPAPAGTVEGSMSQFQVAGGKVACSPMAMIGIASILHAEPTRERIDAALGEGAALYQLMARSARRQAGAVADFVDFDDLYFHPHEIPDQHLAANNLRRMATETLRPPAVLARVNAVLQDDMGVTLVMRAYTVSITRTRNHWFVYDSHGFANTSAMGFSRRFDSYAGASVLLRQMLEGRVGLAPESKSSGSEVEPAAKKRKPAKGKAKPELRDDDVSMTVFVRR